MRAFTFGIAAFVTCLLLGNATGRDDAPKKQTDEEITKLLVGKWEVDLTDGNVKIKGTTQYKKDGTMQSDGTIDTGNQKIMLELSGTWKVKDGVVTETVTKSNRPEIIKEGFTTMDTVISLDDKTYKSMTYKSNNEKGKVIEAKRVKMKE